MRGIIEKFLFLGGFHLDPIITILLVFCFALFSPQFSRQVPKTHDARYSVAKYKFYFSYAIVIKIDELLLPVSTEIPCGADLYYSGELIALEDLATQKPVTSEGDKRVANDDSLREPNWGKVSEMCEGLLRRSRDLRVAGFYVAACLRTEGLPGFAHALDTMWRMLERWGSDINPPMNPNDPGSVQERLSAIVGIAAPYNMANDLLRVRDGLRKTPLASTPNGLSNYAQIIASRKADGTDDPSVISALRDAWKKTSVQKRDAVIQSIKSAMASVAAIENWITNKIPSKYVPSDPTMGSVSPLIDELKIILKLLDEKEKGSALQTTPQTAEELAKKDLVMETPSQPAFGEIQGRDDAIRMLGLVRDYLQRVEPTCPANFFIDRAIKLIGKNFLDALSDLVPDAKSKFEELAGLLQNDQKKDGV